MNGLSNKEAYLELAAKSNVYKLPLQPSSPNTTSREPYALKQRHAAYSEMLSLLTLSDRHRENLLERSLGEIGALLRGISGDVNPRIAASSVFHAA